MTEMLSFTYEIEIIIYKAELVYNMYFYDTCVTNIN